MYTVGVDIGGTKVAIAIVDKGGNILKQKVIPTNLTISPSSMITKINQTITELMRAVKVTKEQLNGIGIGAPGPLDSKKGIIACPPNMKNWVDIPIVEQIANTFQLPVVLENDANAAALAEKWIGAAKENKNFTYITISTGIGAGLFVDGKLLQGVKGNAGDIGHIVVAPAYGQCTCGQYGCLEYVASGTAIAREGSSIVGKKLSTKEVFELYELGHPQVVPFIKDVFRNIGVATVTIINTVDPEKIIFGGGVSKVGEPMFRAIEDYVRRYALSPSGRNTEIVPASLDQSAGVVGAAALCFGLGKMHI